MPEIDSMVWTGLLSCSTLLIGCLVWIAKNVSSDMKDLTESVQSLNVNIGAILVTQKWHNKTLDEHGKRIEKLEDQ